ncbi:TolC family protein [Myxococcota bacterium]|nr:TolC family protein [Myxococcota bacterium]
MNALLSLLLLAPISLDQAIDEGLARHPQVRSVEAKISAAVAQRRGLTAGYGPQLRVEGSALLWDSAQTLTLGGGGEGGGGGALPPPATPYEAATAGLLDSLSGLSEMEVRQRLTTSFKVQLAQPLMDLYKIHLGAALGGQGIEARRLERALTTRGITKGIIEIYLRGLQARQALKATQASLTHLQAERGRIEALKAAGLVNHHDLLRLKVAEADALQRREAARDGVEAARLALGLAMGVRRPVEVIEALPPWLEAPLTTAAAEAALSRRLEVRLMTLRGEGASTRARLARADCLPSVNLIAQYEHTTGSELQASDSAFGGVTLSWTAFEWGATRAKIEEAAAGLQEIEAEAAQLKQQILFEIAGAERAFKSASEIIDVAQAAVAQAEEALRLASARFEAAEATATELLAAEAALTGARINLSQARFNRLIALNSLRYARGVALRGQP